MDDVQNTKVHKAHTVLVISREDGPHARRLLKRKHSKASRRAGKQLLDAAPPRMTSGWWY